MKKAATKSELAHMALVKTMPCVVCWEPVYEPGKIAYGLSISEYDHLVDGHRLGHMFGIPLCTPHHLGKKGYSGGIPWDSSKPHQWKLMEKVYKFLDKPMPEYNPKGRNNFQEQNDDK